MVKLTAPSTSGMRVVRYWPFAEIWNRLGRPMDSQCVHLLVI